VRTGWSIGGVAVLLGLLLAPSARADEPGVGSEAYGEAVRLVESLYLHPDEVEAAPLLRAAARGLARQVHWLLVDTDGDTVYLRHGDGTALGSLSVASLSTLPEALATLEDLVTASGHGLDGVDVRLGILEGLTDALDRYSTVLSGDRLNRFDVRLKGTMGGVGFTLRLVDDGLEVTSLLPESPARQAGVRVGDKVIRIDGVSTMNMPLREASRRIRGAVGTPVVLTLLREGAELSVSLARAELVVPNVEHRGLPGAVGYVRITHFSQRTDENLRVALAALQAEGAMSAGLVIDLRGNTGGSMKDSARSADQFVHDGLLLRTVGPGGGRVRNLQSRMDAVSAGDEPDVPVVILMDRRTASGSEIMAGALVELSRAALVGARSYGKGTVQKVYPIDPRARLKLTVARYVLDEGRTIDADGLVPDVALADLVLDEDGVRRVRFDPADTGAPPTAVIPVVVEREGWRGQAVDEGDVRLEVARRAVMAARGPGRPSVVSALTEAAEAVRAEQEARLAEAFEARGIDWSRDPERPRQDQPPPVDLSIEASVDPEDPDARLLRVALTHRGEHPLEQARVELSCESFGGWHGIVIPFGRVASGATVEGTHRLRLRAGIAPREDEVVATLFTAHHPPAPAESVVLEAASAPEPEIALTAHLDRGPTHHTARVTVHNLSDETLTGVEVAFAHPGDLDVELLEHAARVPRIGPRGSARLDLDLRLGPEAPELLPLHLAVESDGFRADLADWPLTLPRDGRAVSLQAPRVVTEGLPLSSPVGPWSLPIRVTDETRLDHVVVFANGEKVGWAAGGRAEATLLARFEGMLGENDVLVEATDEHGVVTRERLRIRGESPAAVDAAP
jgi:carboxyl-terminal processing protease